MTASDDTAGSSGPFRDIYLSVVFLTRLPAPDWPEASARKLGGAMWAFPLPGVLVATIAGLVYGICDFLGWPAIAAALVALAAMTIATGGLHEDGLADLADGAWGGAAPARRLEIMSDSRIGAYGAMALIVSFGARATALAEIGEPELVLGALVAAAALSRGLLPAVMAFGTPAKPDGLAATAGTPSLGVWAAAILISVVVVLLAAPAGGADALVMATLGAALTGWFAARTLGGYTGDSLGAVQQVAETVALVSIAAALATMPPG